LPEEDGERIYQCTFCTDRFKHKHDWSRHEKTLHLSLEKWTCTPFGPVFVDPETGRPKCAFCGITEPSDDHAEFHRWSECREKPLATRTFYRNDHLIQHLRLVHGIDKVIPSMKIWKSEIKRVNSRCGFCNERFVLWTERNAHLAKHFREGALMKDWKGCRGLDPGMAALVENAMPPYLIGAEAKGVIPFSASRLAAGGGIGTQAALAESCDADGNFSCSPVKATPFEFLTVRLGQFVVNARRAGTTLTDETLQQEARRIVYGDDDPWNQTAADNLEWLHMFKSGHGLSTDSGASLGLSFDQLRHIESRDAELHLSWMDKCSLPVVTTDMQTDAGPGMSSLLCNDGDNPGIDQLAPTCADLMPNIPWALQSPECLAEFRAQCQLALSRATCAVDSGDCGL
jgi:hypothetical protein